MAVPVNGGWDAAYGYVRIFCFLVISAAAALIWTLLDRKRRNHARLYEGLRVYIRFVLAVAMIEYGAVKVIPTQFPAPALDRSSHLLLMAVFLAAHDLRRLANLLVLNRPAEPEEVRPLFRRKGLARAAAALAAVFIFYITGTALYQSHRTLVEIRTRPPFYGVWNVEELRVDGKVRPPLTTDETRWRRAFFSAPGRFSIQLMSDSLERYNLVLDETKRTLDIRKRVEPSWKTTLVYRQPKPDVLVVEGPFDGQEIHAQLRRTVPPELVLKTRGFHWINERPFNR